jgi:hypothetical protein
MIEQLVAQFTGPMALPVVLLLGLVLVMIVLDFRRVRR